MLKKEYKVAVGGKEIIFETNDLNVFSDSSILVSSEGTKVLINITISKEESRLDYLPLKVEYLEKFYARGEILGGKYNKREGKPSEEASLTARAVDRSVRPFFPKNFRHDVNIFVTTLALGKTDPDILALNGASVALLNSSISWNGPVFSFRIARDKENNFELNPNYDFYQNEKNLYEATISFRENKICMVELEGEEVLEDFLKEDIKKAEAEIFTLEKVFSEIHQENKKDKIKTEEEELKISKDKIETLEKKIFEAFPQNGKEEFIKKFYLENKSLFHVFDDEYLPEKKALNLIEKFVKKSLRKNVLENKKRIDGRSLGEVRKIFAQAGGFSENLHGSGIFYRGDTRVFSVLTLGSLDDALFIDGMEIQAEKNFIHHYNFLPFTVGETGRVGSPKRREIGHGALAEKAFLRMIPNRDEFPYTMRVVSEVMSSAGSTSMASVCATTLALLNGGVSLKKLVAGVGIGLVEEGENYELLTDILGTEDFYGDMDFKIAGTDTGINAIQLDIKNLGLSFEIFQKALEKAKTAREEILEKIKNEISEPAEISEKVERVEKMEIPKEKIGLVIGTGGATIKKITKNSGARINIKRDGQAFFYGKIENIKKAKEEIEKILNRD